MTPLQRRVTAAVFLMVLFSALVTGGLTFLIEPMAEELSLSDDIVDVILAIPAIASLLVIFISGQLGDRLGHRRTLLAASAGFTVGGLLMAMAHGPIEVGIGLALCGATATAIQIVALGLLQQTVPSGPAHTSAFTTFGMVFPLAFLVFPITTAGVLEVANWRWIPISWGAAGVLIALIARFALDHPGPAKPMGEWFTPVLAGITLMAMVRTLDTLGRNGALSSVEIVVLIVGVIAGLGCYLLMRRNPHSSFTLRPIRHSTMLVLLLSVALVAMVTILVYVTIAIEYMYDMEPLKTSLVTAPAQLSAVLGAKFLAGKAIARWGIGPAGRYLMLALGISMLSLLFIHASTSVWFLIGCTVIFSGLGMAAITVFNTDVMSRAPHNNTGPVSSFRGAASAIGTAIGVVVLGSGVLSAASIDAGSHAVTSAQVEQLASALRVDGVIGCLIALAGWVALISVERRSTASGLPTA